MRYKGKESASGIGRKLPIIRPGAITVVADNSVGPMTTKGQMKPASRVSITAFQAGENSETNGHEHTIISSILRDLVFKRSNGRREVSSDPLLTSEAAELKQRVYHKSIQHIKNCTVCIRLNKSSLYDNFYNNLI